MMANNQSMRCPTPFAFPFNPLGLSLFDTDPSRILTILHHQTLLAEEALRYRGMVLSPKDPIRFNPLMDILSKEQEFLSKRSNLFKNNNFRHPFNNLHDFLSTIPSKEHHNLLNLYASNNSNNSSHTNNNSSGGGGGGGGIGSTIGTSNICGNIGNNNRSSSAASVSATTSSRDNNNVVLIRDTPSATTTSSTNDKNIIGSSSQEQQQQQQSSRPPSTTISTKSNLKFNRDIYDEIVSSQKLLPSTTVTGTTIIEDEYDDEDEDEPRSSPKSPNSGGGISGTDHQLNKRSGLYLKDNLIRYNPMTSDSTDQRSSIIMNKEKSPTSSTSSSPSLTIKPIPESVLLQETIEEETKCVVCNAIFPSVWLLEQHAALQHANLGPMEEKPFICDQCGQSYRYRSAYVKHREQNHRARLPADKLFTCDVCGMQFRYLKSFKKHRLNHALERLHGKQERRNAELGSEMVSSSNETVADEIAELQFAIKTEEEEEGDQDDTIDSPTAIDLCSGSGSVSGGIGNSGIATVSASGTSSCGPNQNCNSIESGTMGNISGSGGVITNMNLSPSGSIAAAVGGSGCLPSLAEEIHTKVISSSDMQMHHELLNPATLLMNHHHHQLQQQHQQQQQQQQQQQHLQQQHQQEVRNFILKQPRFMHHGHEVESTMPSTSTINSLINAERIPSEQALGLNAQEASILNFLRVDAAEKQRDRSRFACPFCGKCVRSKENLKLHVRKHTGERPFVCLFCGRAFGGKSDLTRHLRIHTGERPYHCEACGKCFARADYLSKHLTTHVHNSPR